MDIHVSISMQSDCSGNTETSFIKDITLEQASEVRTAINTLISNYIYAFKGKNDLNSICTSILKDK